MEVMVSSDGPTSRTMSRAHQALATVRRARSGEASAAAVTASEGFVKTCKQLVDTVNKVSTHTGSRSSTHVADRASGTVTWPLCNRYLTVT